MVVPVAVLLRAVLLGVDRVPVVQALVVELTWRVVTCQLKQLVLFEGLAHGRGGARHHGDVGISNVAGVHGLDGLVQPVQLLADVDVVRRHRAGDVAVESQPVNGALIAGAIPVVGAGELGRQGGLAKHQPVDLPSVHHQLVLD